MVKCKILYVPKDICYLKFGKSSKNSLTIVAVSEDDFETIRGEQLIIDYTEDRKILGIELLSSIKARKACQEK